MAVTPPMADARTEVAAMVAARSVGRPVEVLSRRSETARVFANPDGTWTLEQYEVPVRVRQRSGDWVPVDTSQRVAADGTLEPVATVSRLKFSAGGSGPLVRMGGPGGEIVLSWLRSLPVPTVQAVSEAMRQSVLGALCQQLPRLGLGSSQPLTASTSSGPDPSLDCAKKGTPIMSTRENVEVVREVLGAVERRDARRFIELVHPDFEILWPPSLPYGGTYRELEVGARQGRPTWPETWDRLQPTAAERRMDPRVVAASDEEVVVLWRQRGLSPTGERFDGPVLGLYQVRDGKLARAQMFYFDTAALTGFLANAERDEAGK